MRRNLTRTGLARKQRQYRYIIESWSDRLPDTPAFILGNGPSLNTQPIELIKDYFTIGINRIFKKFDPTILIWQDISFWNTEYQNISNTQSIKIVRDVADPRKLYYNFHLKGGPYKFEPTTPHILYGRGSTGPLAVQLAVSFGCRPIVLLGMDCKRDSENGQSDFWGNNKHWTDSTLSNCLLGLISIKEQCPVEVYNCSNNDLWTFVELKEILAQINISHKRNRKSYVSQILNISEKSS